MGLLKATLRRIIIPVVEIDEKTFQLILACVYKTDARIEFPRPLKSLAVPLWN